MASRRCGVGRWYSGIRLAQAMPQYDKAKLVMVTDLDGAKARAFGDMFGCQPTPRSQRALGRAQRVEERSDGKLAE